MVQKIPSPERAKMSDADKYEKLAKAHQMAEKHRKTIGADHTVRCTTMRTVETRVWTRPHHAHH